MSGFGYFQSLAGAADHDWFTPQSGLGPRLPIESTQLSALQI